MVALPAVLVSLNSRHADVVGDGGAAGRAGVEKFRCRRCWRWRRCRPWCCRGTACCRHWQWRRCRRCRRCGIERCRVVDGRRMRMSPVLRHRRSERAGVDRGAAGIGVVARQRQRAGAGLDQRAAGAAVNAAVGNDSADRGRQIVAANGELFSTRAEVPRALDRAGGRSRRCQVREIENAAGIVDQRALPPLLVPPKEVSRRCCW